MATAYPAYVTLVSVDLAASGDGVAIWGMDPNLNAFGDERIVSTEFSIRTLPPDAIAGPDQTVDEGASVTLAGSGSDSDGTVAAYRWVQTGGLAVTLVGGDTATAGFTAPYVQSATTLSFLLSVVDDQGAVGAASVDIYIDHANMPPTAHAGAYQDVDEGTVVVLAGNGSDPDGSIVAYQWAQLTGPTVILSGATTATATFVAPEVAVDTSFSFLLTVMDNSGATANAVTTVIVKPVNKAPIANAGPDQTVNEGSTVALSGSGTDADGSIAGYAWTQTAGPTVTLSGAGTATATFTACQVSADTVLTFKLTVTDNEGATGTDPANVTVKNVAEGVDLVVTNAGSSVATVQRGGKIMFTTTTANIGKQSTSASTYTGMYLSTDVNITTADTYLNKVSVSSLAAGASKILSADVTVPSTLAPGTYYLGAIADYTGKQVERNESNNAFAGMTIVVK